MKIFIVGSEGAGKTVFLAMLSRYLHEHSSGMVLEPADFQTSQYIVNVQQALENGEWPPSTRMGQSFVLKWNFGGAGRTTQQLLMYDAAGQDLRTLMLAEDLEDLSAQDKGALAAIKSDPGDAMGSLREQIHNADVLVYLLDLEPFLGTSDRQIQNEHCWLLHTFLTHPRWKETKRIVLLSKKDKYEALLAESANDVRLCISAHLPSFYSVTHHLDNSNVQFSAVSSIATECSLGTDGTPLRMPSRPFRPGDMAEFVKLLTDLASAPPFLPSSADHSAVKVACASCGAAILITTSNRHGGKCAICAKKTPTTQSTGCLLVVATVIGSSSCIVGLVLGLFYS